MVAMHVMHNGTGRLDYATIGLAESLKNNKFKPNSPIRLFILTRSLNTEAKNCV